MSAAPAVTYRVSAPAPDMLFYARGVQWHGKWDQRMGLHSDLSTGGKWGDWGIISNYFILCHYGGFYVGGNVNNGDIMWPQIHNIILHHHLLCWAEAELLDIYLRCSSLGFPFELSSPPWQLRGGCAAARAEKLFNASCPCILSTALPGPTPGPLLHLDIIIVFLPMPNVT